MHLLVRTILLELYNYTAALVDNEDIKAGNLASYSDGSVENDLPMQQLSELFNVNHFIVSQVCGGKLYSYRTRIVLLLVRVQYCTYCVDGDRTY